MLLNFDYFTTGGTLYAGLVQGTDGAIYGTAQCGGSSGAGTAFKMNADGTGFTVLKNFDYSTTGGYPRAGLVQGTDGNLYGTAQSGGNGGGVIFRLLFNTAAPEITLIRDGRGFGHEVLSGTTEEMFDVPVGQPSRTLQLIIRNDGDAPLILSGTPFVQLTGSTDFSLEEQPDTGTIAPTVGAYINVNFTPTSPGLKTATLTIANNDSDEGTYTIVITSNGIAFTPAVNDAVTRTTGTTRVYPLANDGTNGAIITAVTGAPGATISADGRSIIIPAGFTGTLSYVTDASTSADVVVTAGTPISGPNRWSGLLYDGNGDIAGIMSATGSATGRSTASIKLGSVSKGFRFTLNASGQATQTLSLGTVNLAKDPATEQLTVSLVSGANTYTGTLRAAQSSATPRQYNIAFASVDTAYPGGGFARATVRATGEVYVSGKLPDGRGFTNKTRLLDNDGMVIYATVSKSQSTGIIAGELVAADLTRTDMTGELAWAMGTQPLGLHASGVDTILTANGSLFASGDTLPAGAVELVASGGNLVAPLTVATTASAGVPTASTVFPSWRISLNRAGQTGQFTAKVKTPTNLKSVSGSGVYLPKSNSAFGWFPGTTLGGRIELTQP